MPTIEIPFENVIYSSTTAAAAAAQIHTESFIKKANIITKPIYMAILLSAGVSKVFRPFYHFFTGGASSGITL